MSRYSYTESNNERRAREQRIAEMLDAIRAHLPADNDIRITPWGDGVTMGPEDGGEYPYYATADAAIAAIPALLPGVAERAARRAAHAGEARADWLGRFG